MGDAATHVISEPLPTFYIQVSVQRIADGFHSLQNEGSRFIAIGAEC